MRRMSIVSNQPALENKTAQRSGSEYDPPALPGRLGEFFHARLISRICLYIMYKGIQHWRGAQQQPGMARRYRYHGHMCHTLGHNLSGGGEVHNNDRQS